MSEQGGDSCLISVGIQLRLRIRAALLIVDSASFAIPPLLPTAKCQLVCPCLHYSRLILLNQQHLSRRAAGLRQTRRET